MSGSTNDAAGDAETNVESVNQIFNPSKTGTAFHKLFKGVWSLQSSQVQLKL